MSRLVDELLRLCGLVPVPGTEQWTYTSPDGPSCPHCGAAVEMTIPDEPIEPWPGAWNFRITHRLPVCPEFARAVEDLPE